MKIIIVGGGNVGKNLAQILSRQKHDITLVESNDEFAKEIASSTDVLVIKGDGTNIEILEDAQIKKADAIVAATQDDKTNLMICEIAKSIPVPRVIGRVNSPGNEELFVKLGINSIIPVTQMAVTAISNTLRGAGERVIAEISDGKVQIMEFVIQQGSKLDGFEGNQINGSIIGSIYRDGTVIIADKNAKLEGGDVISVIVKSEKIPILLKKIKE